MTVEMKPAPAPATATGGMKVGKDTLTGTDGPDSLTGGNGTDQLDGGAGDDELAGGNGADTLDGGDGDDTLDGGNGPDTLIGGTGDDTIIGGLGRDTAVFTGLAEEYDWLPQPDGSLLFTDSVAGRDGVDTLFGIEWLRFADQLVALGSNEDDDGDGGEALTGTDSPDSLAGGNGKDALAGLEGDDSLDGGNGTDLLDGGAGDDELAGGNGADTLDGGDDDDTLDGGNGADTLIGGTGDDTITGGLGPDIAVLSGLAQEYVSVVQADGSLLLTDSVADRDGVDTLFGVERLQFADQVVVIGSSDDEGDDGSDGAVDDGTDDQALTGTDGPDSLAGGNGKDTLAGLEGDDSLTGGNGTDQLDGGAGDDELAGGNGADTLDGGDGDDTLDGGNGPDTLIGGTGDDTIIGGLGRDTAVFTGLAEEYDWLPQPDGSLLFTDSVAGRDGVDTLFGIEWLRFADQPVALGSNDAMPAPSAGMPRVLPITAAVPAPMLAFLAPQDPDPPANSIGPDESVADVMRLIGMAAALAFDWFT